MPRPPWPRPLLRSKGLYPRMKLAYFTDVEGRWNKIEDFVQDNPVLRLADGRLELEDDGLLVFGGDAIDRGPSGRRILRLLVEAAERWPDRVILLAGNRDINKLRLARELHGHPRSGAPAGSRVELLRWTLASSMGAGSAFAHREVELGCTPEEVVDSFLEDLEPEGWLWRYLERARLGFCWEHTLFLHGGVTRENFCTVPGGSSPATVEGWLSGLQDFYRRQLQAFRKSPQGTDHAALVAYQAPLPGTRANQQSVVYARMTVPDGNPVLPPLSLQNELLRQGIQRVVVGHTPAGDSPALLRRGNFELIAADNSYGRLECGSQVFLDARGCTVRARVQPGLDKILPVSFHLPRPALMNEASFIGRRDVHTGQLVTGGLADGRWLLFRFGQGHDLEQEVTANLEGRSWEAY